MKTVRAVIGRTDENGELKDISFETAMVRDLEHYIKPEMTSMPYRQIMAIMASVDFIRVFILTKLFTMDTFVHKSVVLS